MVIRRPKIQTVLVVISLMFVSLPGCQNEAKQSPTKSKQKAGKTAQEKETGPKFSEPISLFDGKSLEGWDEIEFGGEGDIYTDDGVISFEMGDPFTGICSDREDLPQTNYEIELEARKTDGVDFFCGLTFPVDESHCTLILGGWGGDVCGLSCIDDQDASSNDTSTSIVFKKNQWYKIRVRVEPNRIQAWLDDKSIINCDTSGKKISLRGDTTLCEPLGICSFQTLAEYRNIVLRTFKPVVTATADGAESK